MSARREARAASVAAEGDVQERDVLALLRDPDAPIWKDPVAYAAFMRERGWTLPTRDRWGVCAEGPPMRDAMAAPPIDRRNTAAEQWAVENGITRPDHAHFADLHRLRAMGCYGTPDRKAIKSASTRKRKA